MMDSSDILKLAADLDAARQGCVRPSAAKDVEITAKQREIVQFALGKLGPGGFFDGA